LPEVHITFTTRRRSVRYSRRLSLAVALIPSRSSHPARCRPAIARIQKNHR